MKILKFGLNLGNRFYNYILIIILVLAISFAGYGLWDNNRIYAEANNVQDDMLKYKPDKYEPSFEELLGINKDVKAWLTLDNTNIDYPILQGKTNLSYFNTDVYGNFSLAGSIYLDSRNDENFKDSYSLIYGHHMEKRKMFGDLSLYKKEKFFKENQSGTLILPDRTYDLKIFGVLTTSSGEGKIFNPGNWLNDIDGLIEFARDNHLYLEEENLDFLDDLENPQILALATCSSEFTDARTILLVGMIPYED